MRYNSRMTRQQTPPQKKLKLWQPVLAIIVILLILLLADLQFRGLAWRYIYNQTGEETVIGQIQGMVELSGNLIRLPLQEERFTPIQHTDIYPYGVNTFFEQEADPDKMRVQFQMISDAGFGWIRQEFPWEDIEVDGRGQFTDTRYDYDGDGTPDTISAWDKYDNIVDLAEEHNLDMIVRLSNPPEWSRANNPDTDGGAKAPPDDYQDFVNYAVAVAERYQGRIQYYQVWNEPNIYPEWGDQLANPADYTRLLCMTYDALKAVDPDIVVISGTIAPTASLDQYWGYHDLVYLQNMYDNGAGDCFDVLSAQGYGLNSGPTDRRQRLTHLSFARHMQYRDIMVTNGDADKPIWLSEVAWSPMESPCLMTGECLSLDQISGAGNFGSVTNEQAATYLTGAYDRAQQEWSWIGHISYWHFTRPTIEESNQVAYWFRMVEADYSEENPTFSPLPVYDAARGYLLNIQENPVLYRGVHQAESWEITLSDTATVLAESDADFGEAIQSDLYAFTMHGTSLTIHIQAGTPVNIFRDGEMIETIVIDPMLSGWQQYTFSNGIIPRNVTYTLSSDTDFLLDRLTIRSEFAVLFMPALCGVLAIAGAALILGYPILRHRRRNERIESQRQQLNRQFRRR